MIDERNVKIKEHTEKLEKIYKERRMWLYASSIVYTAIILIIFGWDFLIKHSNQTVWWSVISIGLLISVNWWYWTMKSIGELVRSIYTEYEMLNDISEDIETFRCVLKRNLIGDYTKCNNCPSTDKCKK